MIMWLQINEFMREIEYMAKRSLRCIAFAYRTYDIEHVPSNKEQLEQWKLPEDDLVLLAIAGLKVHKKIHIAWCFE